MLSDQVPDPLRERLGAEATAGLLDLFETAELEWQEDVLRASTERFERRLAEECGKLRLEMTEMKAELRLEMAGMRQDMRHGFAGLRQEMTAQKFDILKWVFLFWVSQSLTMVGFLLTIVRSIKGGG